jgi:putative ABC transport system substrate-binding protein
MRRVAFVTLGADSESSPRQMVTILQEGLPKLGWVEGRNLRLDLRFGAGDAERTRAYAAELFKLRPDVIVTQYAAAHRAVQALTRTIPIVFAGAGDPTDLRLVDNLARPEGNATGFANLFASIGGKWFELLKEAAPAIARVAVPFNADSNSSTATGYVPSIEAAAQVAGVRVVKIPVRNGIDIVRALDAFAAEPNGGLIANPSAVVIAPRELIQLSIQHRLPAIFQSRGFAEQGGLLSYGSTPEAFRDLPTYVDRLLRGAKVIELPVQFPTKFELVINLKTAKAIGLTIPEAFLLRADEVIE